MNEEKEISFNYSPNNSSIICKEGVNSSSLNFSVSYERDAYKEEEERKGEYTLLIIDFSKLVVNVTSLNGSSMYCSFSENKIICKNKFGALKRVVVEYTIQLFCPLYCGGNNQSTRLFDINIMMKESSGFFLKTKETQEVVCECTPVPPPPPTPTQCNNCVYKSDESTHLYNRKAGTRISLESLVNTVHSHLSTCNVTYMSTNTVVGTFILQWQYHWKVSFSSFPEDIGNIFFTLPFSGNYSLYCCTSSLIDIGGLAVFQEYGPFIQLGALCPSTSSVQLEEHDVGFYFVNTTVDTITSQCLLSFYPDQCIQFMLNNTSPSSSLSYFLDIKSITNVGGQLSRITSVFLEDSSSTHCSSPFFYCSCLDFGIYPKCVSSYDDCYLYCNHSIKEFGETLYILHAVQGLNWVSSVNTPSSSCSSSSSPCRLISPSPLILTYFTSVSTNASYTDLYILYNVLSYNHTNITTSSVVLFDSTDTGYFNISTQKNIYSDYQVSSLSSSGNYDCNNAFYTMHNITLFETLNYLQVTYKFDCNNYGINGCPTYDFSSNDYTCTIFHNNNEILKYNSFKILYCDGLPYSDGICNGNTDCINTCNVSCIHSCILNVNIPPNDILTYTCCTGKNYNNYPSFSPLKLNENIAPAMIVPDYLSPPFSCFGNLSSSCLTESTSLVIPTTTINSSQLIVPSNQLTSNNVIWCGVFLTNEGDSPSPHNTTIMRFTISRDFNVRNIQCQNDYQIIPNGCRYLSFLSQQIITLQCVSSNTPYYPLFQNNGFSLLIPNIGSLGLFIKN